MRARAALALALAVAACSAPAPKPTPIANEASGERQGVQLADADEAIDRFVVTWNESVRPTVPMHKDVLIGRIDRSMRDADARSRYRAERKPCDEATRRMIKEMELLQYDFVLYGSMAQANAHPSCWVVTYYHDMTDAEGLLDPDTGELLVVWRIPDG